MRPTAFVLFALFVIACRAAPTPEPLVPVTPTDVAVELDAPARERLAFGLPLALEMRAGTEQVGACTVTYDIWDENYRVMLTKTDVLRTASPAKALRSCVDMDRVRSVARGQRVATIIAREVDAPKPAAVPAIF